MTTTKTSRLKSQRRSLTAFTTSKVAYGTLLNKQASTTYKILGSQQYIFKRVQNFFRDSTRIFLKNQEPTYLDQQEVDQEVGAKTRPETQLNQLQTTKDAKEPAVSQEKDPKPNTPKTKTAYVHIKHFHALFLQNQLDAQ